MPKSPRGNKKNNEPASLFDKYSEGLELEKQFSRLGHEAPGFEYDRNEMEMNPDFANISEQKGGGFRGHS